jgi:hypothetical protein
VHAAYAKRDVEDSARFSLALREADDLSLSLSDAMADRSGDYGLTKRVAILNYCAISTL